LFTQTSDGIIIASGASGQSFSFETDISAIYVASGDGDIIGSFTITADGELLWTEINASAVIENWSEITEDNGNTWTEINAGGTIETWNNMVV
jgi:hypothetical protein